MDKHYREAMDQLVFSPEAKENLISNLTAATQKSAQVSPAQEPAHTPPAQKYSRQAAAKYTHRKPWGRAVAAAVAVVALTVSVGGAYASGALMEMGQVFDDVFGGAPAQTEVIDAIGHPIGASDTSNGVTITAEAIIGDNETCVIVYSISKDDGSAFEGIPSSDSGCLSLRFESGDLPYVKGTSSVGGSTYFYDSDPSDNAIQYVEILSFETSDNTLSGKTAYTSFENLSMYTEEGQEILAEGTWKLSFDIAYEDTSVNIPAGQAFDLSGMDASVNEIRMSPLSLTVHYEVETDLIDIGPNNSESSYDPLYPSIILTLEDGTTIDASGGASTLSDEGSTISGKVSYVFDELIDIDAMTSITIEGVEITVS